MRFVLVLIVALILAACESNPPAPVIERTPQSSKPKPPVVAKPIDPKTATAKDWRPDNHTVTKGDTLFGIGLQYGIDYKEIAAANNIAPPYPIKIGQKLDLSSFKTKTVTAASQNSGQNSNQIAADTSKAGDAVPNDGVIVTPIKVEPVTMGTATKPATTGSAVTPILTEPKATREVYSVSAWNRAVAPQNGTKMADAKTDVKSDVKTTDNKTVDNKPVDNKPSDVTTAEAKPADDESLAWGWPTQGKVSLGFNEASNKGIDIAGTTGQAISAAAPGKVIYSGSDLRGYGKLVIIKHNKTYLSVYAHNSKILVKEGQVIAAGQKIAEMGNTDANSVKLHFEIRRLGKSVDPAKYLN